MRVSTKSDVCLSNVPAKETAKNAFNLVTPQTILIGWKKSFEKLSTQMTCEFMVISQLLGGQF